MAIFCPKCNVSTVAFLRAAQAGLAVEACNKATAQRPSKAREAIYVKGGVSDLVRAHTQRTQDEVDKTTNVDDKSPTRAIAYTVTYACRSRTFFTALRLAPLLAGTTTLDDDDCFWRTADAKDLVLATTGVVKREFPRLPWNNQDNDRIQSGES